jgi:hypothetical protein
VADFSASPSAGEFELRNKGSRVISLCSDIRGFFARDALTPTEAESFASKVTYACSFKFGRCGRWASGPLRNRAKAKTGISTLTLELKESLNWWVYFLTEAAPRLVRCWCPEPPACLFTDGACEPGAITCGAVLFYSRRVGPVFFGFTIPEEWCSAWRECSGEQVIAQAELFPNLIARLTWPELLKGAQVLSFIDSDPARFALMKGFSPVRSCSWIVASLWRQEAALGISTWFDRVPGPSNVADAVSRLSYEEILSMNGAFCSQPVFPPTGCDPSLPLHPLLSTVLSSD